LAAALQVPYCKLMGNYLMVFLEVILTSPQQQMNVVDHFKTGLFGYFKQLLEIQHLKASNN
jgi:hypothetical protein